jgi:hypothetical protein
MAEFGSINIDWFTIEDDTLIAEPDVENYTDNHGLFYESLVPSFSTTRIGLFRWKSTHLPPSTENTGVYDVLCWQFHIIPAASLKQADFVMDIYLPQIEIPPSVFAYPTPTIVTELSLHFVSGFVFDDKDGRIGKTAYQQILTLHPEVTVGDMAKPFFPKIPRSKQLPQARCF